VYNELFNQKLQHDMQEYFAVELSELGTRRKIKKNKIIDPDNADHIYIILEGSFDQLLYCGEGEEISFFRLSRGTLFGEMDYFDGFRTCFTIKALEDSVVSIIHRNVLERELQKKPSLYRYFLHSTIRKFRIVSLELADIKFNNTLGKLANTLIRLAHTSQSYGVGSDNNRINMNFTHKELANRIGANRSSVTSGLNFFKERELIKIENKVITILNSEELEKYGLL